MSQRPNILFVFSDQQRYSAAWGERERRHPNACPGCDGGGGYGV
jgi:hypothetical protein